MKFKSLTLSLSSILSLAAAAATAPPSGFAVIYTLASCSQVDTPTGVANYRNIKLSYNACETVAPLFLSFQGGFNVKCPKNKKPVVKAFPEVNCGGTPVTADQLPTDMSPGSCLEVLVSLNGSSGSSTSTPGVGGRSLIFTCIKTRVLGG